MGVSASSRQAPDVFRSGLRAKEESLRFHYVLEVLVSRLVQPGKRQAISDSW